MWFRLRPSDWYAFFYAAIVLACAYGTWGCGAYAEPYVRVVAVDDELAVPLAYAAARWYVATGLDVRRSPGGVWVERGTCKGDPLGCYEFDSKRIAVAPRVVEGFAETVLVHEVGHALALKGCTFGDEPACSYERHHDGAPRSIMLANLHPDVQSCLTADDLRFVCAYAYCAWKRPEC